MKQPLRCFAVSIKGREHETPVNAITPGQAKREFFLSLDGCLPGLKFTDLRCRVQGPPHTSRDFERNAEYRGCPRVKCGDRVMVGEAIGYIVGHNSSANFDVLFDQDSPKYAGLRLSVHPSEMKLT